MFSKNINSFCSVMKEAYDVVLIRHAQSTFNHATLRVQDELKLDGSDWWGLVNHPEFNNRVTYNKNYFNAELSEHGLKQCEEMKHKTKDLDVDVIIVSPYTRALQTCQILFEGHKAEIIVQPVLAQIFRYSCDVAHPLEDHQQKFPSFNFSQIEPHGGEWYLSYLPETTQEQIKKYFIEYEAKELHEKSSVILKMMNEGKLKEEYNQFRARVEKVKQLVKKYKEKYGKVAVVCHYHVIEFMKAKDFTEDGNVVDYKGVLNCHPYYEKLEDLIL